MTSGNKAPGNSLNLDLGREALSVIPPILDSPVRQLDTP